jgi:hypothetical protein
LRDTEIVSVVPKVTSYTGGVAHFECCISVEAGGTVFKARSIKVGIGSVGASADTEKVDIVDEVVCEAGTDAGSVGGDILSIVSRGTDIDAHFNVGVGVCKELNCRVAWTVVGTNLVKRVTIVVDRT